MSIQRVPVSNVAQLWRKASLSFTKRCWFPANCLPLEGADQQGLGLHRHNTPPCFNLLIGWQGRKTWNETDRMHGTAEKGLGRVGGKLFDLRRVQECVATTRWSALLRSLIDMSPQGEDYKTRFASWRHKIIFDARWKKIASTNCQSHVRLNFGGMNIWQECAVSSHYLQVSGKLYVHLVISQGKSINQPELLGTEVLSVAIIYWSHDCPKDWSIGLKIQPSLGTYIYRSVKFHIRRE
jgi:hypothetical protein